MITNFWLISVVLCLVAAGFVLIPLFRHRPTDDGQADRSLLNVELYRERLAELEKNQLEGEITAEQFASLKLELEQNLLSETAMRDEGNPETADGNAMSGAQSRKIPKLVLTAALLVPLFAVTAYSDFGLSWGAINDLELASQFKTTSPHDNDGMRGSILRLAKRLENQPENHDGWVLLGQSYMNLGEFEKSAGAYQHLLEKFPEDAGLSGYYAEALFLADDRKMTARVSKAIDAAYSLNPQNVAMLEIKAMNAFRAGDLGVAVTLFEKALATGVEGERAGLIQQAIARLRAELGNKAPPPAVMPAGPVAPLANSAPAAATKAADTPSAPIRSVQLLVEVADTVESNPNDSVFVYAKANAGPPMPLAVERMRVSDLPRLVTLDETMGMMQGMSLANFDAVILVARISSSGIANTSPDDFQAASGVVDITSENPVIKLLIESRVRDQ
ncbi:MAG: c-type cytochrome biogenesis protein CcmI [Gammaproteobacteria bacterium]|nr:c-type cytochrome biogenesis protein CcmI [Gammaproteobacteria bacterium]